MLTPTIGTGTPSPPSSLAGVLAGTSVVLSVWSSAVVVGRSVVVGCPEGLPGRAPELFAGSVVVD